jgi:hypothetical protein
MDTDQGTQPTPAGWAFGRQSTKPHYFTAGAQSSLCGKVISANLARKDRVPFASDCVVCARKYKENAEKTAAANRQ